MLPEKVRARLWDGTTVRLEHASVDRDSLRGLVSPADAAYRTDRHVAFALKDVRAIEARRLSTGKTVGLVLGVIVVCGGVGLLLFAASLAEGN
jgi:hypothetical protein